jgi:sugar/nucleoside kinase (ribokinase family)
MEALNQVVVAGHLALDIHPNLDHFSAAQFPLLFQPGKTILVGPAAFSTGGAVSNTGLALHQLGINTHLSAKIGADHFGEIVQSIISSYNPSLLRGISVDPSENTSYTLIINMPGVDRIFMLCPGANDTFSINDLDFKLISQSSIFHFGYPPVMRSMYANNGKQLVQMFKQVKDTGATTSLDMTFPDPSSEGGLADWQEILKATLPYVDIFMPSIEELLFMLRWSTYDRLKEFSADGSVLSLITPGLLHNISDELLSLGAKVVGLKLGDRGLYLRTSNLAGFQTFGNASPSPLSDWVDRELWGPCFQVKVAGTTGAGDATIAGFLSALLRGLDPVQSVSAALAVGACNVEARDAISGIQPWEDTMARINKGWLRHSLEVTSPGWSWDEANSIWTA